MPALDDVAHPLPFVRRPARAVLFAPFVLLLAWGCAQLLAPRTLTHQAGLPGVAAPR